MKLPENVLVARDRMATADAALHADIESDTPLDRARHSRLLDELHLAADDYVAKITAAVARRCSESMSTGDSKPEMIESKGRPNE
jgi:hypothetical protein